MKEETLYGIHVIQHLLKQAPERFLEIQLLDTRRDQRLETIEKLAKDQGIAIRFVSKKALDAKCKDALHQGVGALVRSKPPLSEHELISLVKSKSSPLLLILDGVQDPHNLGAVLRTCDAVGVDALIVPKDRSAHVTPLVQKVASGAAETVPFIEVTNLARCIEQLKQEGVWIVGASNTNPKSKPLYKIDLRGSIAIVLGAEGTGLRKLTEEHCDFLIEIPMRGSVESLNVSVAAAVCLYEALRQREEV